MTEYDPDEEAPVWVYRPLESVRNVYEWGVTAGVPKMMPPSSLHMTLATVRVPVRWGDLKLRTDTLVIPAGFKTVQIFAYTIKALTFGHPEIKARHEELVEMFPPQGASPSSGAFAVRIRARHVGREG